jgi:two-component system, NtrC family, response regulator HydG
MQQESASGGYGRLSLKALLDAYERQLILTALAATAGNQRRAAASLGLLPTTLHEKMKRLGLVRRPDAHAEGVPAQADASAAV